MAEEQTKLVNVTANRSSGSMLCPVPFRGSVKRMRMTISDIRQCLFAKMKVDEILDNGEVIPLDFTNYAQDNNKKTTATVKIPEKKHLEATILSVDNKGNIIRPASTTNTTAKKDRMFVQSFDKAKQVTKKELAIKSEKKSEHEK